MTLLKSSNKWRGRVMRYGPLILWVGVIMLLSSGQASMGETSRFIRPVLEFLFPSAAPETLLLYHGYIRKSAHLAEYAVLALLVLRALTRSHLQTLFKYRYLISMMIVFLVSGVDELNQSFISSRTGSIQDVILDGLGGLAALSVLFLLKRRWEAVRA
ncbi:MAG: VanZ family protein [Acidobacteriota bacterium]|nr:VanZ family protein [Acidobacteriota bacterium]